MRLPLVFVAAAGLILVAVVFVFGVGGEVQGEARLGLVMGGTLAERDEGSGLLALSVEATEGGSPIREVVAHVGGLENVRTALPEPGKPVMVGQVTDESLQPVAGVVIQCEFQAGSLVLALGDLKTCELGYFFCDLSPLLDLGLQELARGKVVASGTKRGWTFMTTETELLDMLESVQEEDYLGARRLNLGDLSELRWMDSADPLALDEYSLDCDMYMDALPGRKVRGEVVDDAGVGVADAVVWLSTVHGATEFELRAERDGTFEFGLWGEEEQDWGDSLRIHAMHPSQGQSAAVVIPEGDAPVELRLEHRGAIMGYVTSKSGAATWGLEIWMQSEDEQQGLPNGFCTTTVDFDGSFSFHGLLPGRWILNVAGEEYGPFETGNQRIQIETECELLRVSVTAPSDVDLALITLDVWSIGSEGPYLAPTPGPWYTEDDFVRVSPTQWLLELDRSCDMGFAATVDWGESFQTSTLSWRGEGTWRVGTDMSIDLKLEQRGAGSLQVEVALPGGAQVNPSEWTASVWGASNGESVLRMDPGDVESILSGSYTVKLVPDPGLPFDVQFMTVDVLPGQQRELRFQPRGGGARLSLYSVTSERQRGKSDLKVNLFHGDDIQPTPTLWRWNGGCVEGTADNLHQASWNISQRLLMPGEWRAEFVLGGELVEQLKFEIVDGQDLSLAVSLGN
ncbi:MAG: hypothetical protein ACJAZ8_002318 [Planctomycetota bacterium]|jgi:hypothetical protein